MYIPTKLTRFNVHHVQKMKSTTPNLNFVFEQYFRGTQQWVEGEYCQFTCGSYEGDLAPGVSWFFIVAGIINLEFVFWIGVFFNQKTKETEELFRLKICSIAISAILYLPIYFVFPRYLVLGAGILAAIVIINVNLAKGR